MQLKTNDYVCFLMIDFPGTKINLGLRVIKKLDNGYHHLESIFIPTTFSDVVEIIPSREKSAFHFSGISIPGNLEGNLLFKALHLLSKDYSIPNIQIYLHKRIPMGAGLGGGSADASSMLKLLNSTFKLAISINKLESYSEKLGADCPFFIENKTSYVEGIGDSLSPITIDLNGFYLLIVCPEIHIKTSEAFREIKPHSRVRSLPEIIANYPIEEWKDHIYNDFEERAFESYPELRDIKSTLYEMGAIYASMSGTGSAIYGFFKREVEMDKSLESYIYHWEKKSNKRD
jgi:4-diphosphocytidyl-2-C-methyl-D-erythritol kinase